MIAVAAGNEAYGLESLSNPATDAVTLVLSAAIKQKTSAKQNARVSDGSGYPAAGRLVCWREEYERTARPRGQRRGHALGFALRQAQDSD